MNKEYLATYQCSRCPHTKRLILDYDPRVLGSSQPALHCPLCGSNTFFLVSIIEKEAS